MQVKERILQTASVLFHRQGYHATGINQIIAEAQVAKASFYQYFKAKEDLCVAFLNQRHDYWFAELYQYTAQYRTNKTKLLATFDFIAFMNEKEDFRGCSFLNIRSEVLSEKVRILTIVQQHKNDLRQYFETLLSTAHLADHCYLLFESALIESQVFRDQWPIKKAKSIVKQLIQN